MQMFSCDLETTTDVNDCRVWAYGWMEIGNTSNYKIGTDFNEFMEWMIHSSSRLYFHNLKFDGSFIVNWLLHNGYTWTKRPSKEGQFSTLISKMGQWYGITICSGRDGRKKKLTTIHDSLKKLPFPVRKIGKDFKLNVLKGDIDYHKPRPIGYEIDEEEYQYIKNDIQIIAEALEVQTVQGLTGMTNGKDALDEFVNMSGKLYEKLFPIFSLELNEEIRKAYRGGFTWLNPVYGTKKYVKDGIVFDVNSLYPSQMYDRDLPCGVPIPFEGEYVYDKSHPLYIQKLTFEFELKEGFIPTIQLKNSRFGFKGNEYLSSSNGERITISVSSVDWELIKEHYHVYDVEFEKGWKFRSTKQAFKQYIDKWMLVKNMSAGAKKAIAKLMLNSLYGKFATNPDITGKRPYLREDGSNGFELMDEEFRDPVYTPVGIFITSWARYTTITSAQKCYDRIIYCDTDSMHLEGLDVPESIKDIVADDILGYWKKEGQFKRGKFIRQKTYMEEYYAKYVRDENGQIKYDDEKPIKVICDKEESDTTIIEIKCAGMPDNIKKHVTFDNFDIGFTMEGKLKPKQVYGGVVLVEETYTMK